MLSLRVLPNTLRSLRPDPVSLGIRFHRTITTSSPPYKTHIGPNALTPSAHSFWHDETSTWQYVVEDPKSKDALIIDSALDFCPVKNEVGVGSADGIIGFIKDRGLNLTRILETHAHADHLSASRYIKSALATPSNPIPICIGNRITQVQDTFAPKYRIHFADLKDSFDKFWQDDEEFHLGDIKFKVLHLPGHTPDHVGYLAGDFVFVGDSIFLPDVGTARADFPGGNASDLFASGRKLLSLGDHIRVFSGHDYPGGDRAKSCNATIREQRLRNRHLKDDVQPEDFISMREERDGGLGAPRLLHQALQVNIRGGRLPADGQLHLPLKGTVGF